MCHGNVNALRCMIVSGDTLQTAIIQMVDMGFERDQVMRALRASFNNPDRAVEYLMTVSRLELLSIAT